MQISVLGAGYVGLTTAVGLCKLGHTVRCADIDAEKIAALRAGHDYMGEPGMEELLTLGLGRQELVFSTTPEVLRGAKIVFICVGTPSLPDGAVDLACVRQAAGQLAPLLHGDETVVVKSTVPVGTGAWIEAELRARTGHMLHVVSNPEFLREGWAVYDFFHPDRVVVGAEEQASGELVASLYRGLNAPLVLTGRKSAELIKYGANAFLSVKISFINELARLCEAFGVDVEEVSQGVGLDRGVGTGFLAAGAGYGGPCLPKDVAGLLRMAESVGVPLSLVADAQTINLDQRRWMVNKLQAMLGSLAGRTIAVWGLAFKPNTSDVRDAPSLEIIRLCQAHGATVRAYDPMAMPKAAALLPGVEMKFDAWAAADGADALLLVTEWAEFIHADPIRLRQALRERVVVDCRNALDQAAAQRAGLRYVGVGRGGGCSADRAEGAPQDAAAAWAGI